MGFWTEERLRRFSDNEFNRFARRHPAVLFLATFLPCVVGVTLIEDLRLHAFGGAPMSPWWMKYWVGFVIGVAALLDNRRLWRRVDRMK